MKFLAEMCNILDVGEHRKYLLDQLIAGAALSAGREWKPWFWHKQVQEVLCWMQSVRHGMKSRGVEHHSWAYRGEAVHA